MNSSTGIFYDMPAPCQDANHPASYCQGIPSQASHCQASYQPPFSHIYVEEEALRYPAAQKILDSLSGRSPILIQKYQDVFGRAHQDFSVQKNSPSLILAVKHGTFLYPGAPVCQDFGNPDFYYTSFAMNCPFDCEYCYLQGMYPSAHIVLFVNLEDYFEEIRKLLVKHPAYLCISYDTDLLALEHLSGFLERYLDFAAGYPQLITELRTKSAARLRIKGNAQLRIKGNAQGSLAGNLPAAAKSRFIFAYTLSPSSVIRQFEHKTASLERRLEAIRHMHSAGFPIRLCFDPLLRIPDFEKVYGQFFQEVRAALSDIPIQDASVGVFRISDAYLKQMRKQRPDSPLLQYPFTNENHVCHYGGRSRDMIDFATKQLSGWIPRERIYTVSL